MDKITAESSVCGMNIRNGERCAYKKEAEIFKIRGEPNNVHDFAFTAY